MLLTLFIHPFLMQVQVDTWPLFPTTSPTQILWIFIKLVTTLESPRMGELEASHKAKRILEILIRKYFLL
jgi:hypothetical protein